VPGQIDIDLAQNERGGEGRRSGPAVIDVDAISAANLAAVVAAMLGDEARDREPAATRARNLKHAHALRLNVGHRDLGRGYPSQGAL
jgi:hypothetical protein